MSDIWSPGCDCCGCASGIRDITKLVDFTPPHDEWLPSTSYTPGDTVYGPSVADPYGSLRYFECTTGGTSDSSEPTWDTTVDNTTSDNDVVWTTKANTVFESTFTFQPEDYEICYNVVTEALDGSSWWDIEGHTHKLELKDGEDVVFEIEYYIYAYPYSQTVDCQYPMYVWTLRSRGTAGDMVHCSFLSTEYSWPFLLPNLNEGSPAYWINSPNTSVFRFRTEAIEIGGLTTGSDRYLVVDESPRHPMSITSSPSFGGWGQTKGAFYEWYPFCGGARDPMPSVGNIFGEIFSSVFGGVLGFAEPQPPEEPLDILSFPGTNLSITLTWGSTSGTDDPADTIIAGPDFKWTELKHEIDNTNLDCPEGTCHMVHPYTHLQWRLEDDEIVIADSDAGFADMAGVSHQGCCTTISTEDPEVFTWTIVEDRGLAKQDKWYYVQSTPTKLHFEDEVDKFSGTPYFGSFAWALPFGTVCPAPSANWNFVDGVYYLHNMNTYQPDSIHGTSYHGYGTLVNCEGYGPARMVSIEHGNCGNDTINGIFDGNLHTELCLPGIGETYTFDQRFQHDYFKIEATSEENTVTKNIGYDLQVCLDEDPWHYYPTILEFIPGFTWIDLVYLGGFYSFYINSGPGKGLLFGWEEGTGPKDPDSTPTALFQLDEPEVLVTDLTTQEGLDIQSSLDGSDTAFWWGFGGNFFWINASASGGPSGVHDWEEPPDKIGINADLTLTYSSSFDMQLPMASGALGFGGFVGNYYDPIEDGYDPLCIDTREQSEFVRTFMGHISTSGINGPCSTTYADPEYPESIDIEVEPSKQFFPDLVPPLPPGMILPEAEMLPGDGVFFDPLASTGIYGDPYPTGCSNCSDPFDHNPHLLGSPLHQPTIWNKNFSDHYIFTIPGNNPDFCGGTTYGIENYTSHYTAPEYTYFLNYNEVINTFTWNTAGNNECPQRQGAAVGIDVTDWYDNTDALIYSSGEMWDYPTYNDTWNYRQSGTWSALPNNTALSYPDYNFFPPPPASGHGSRLIKYRKVIDRPVGGSHVYPSGSGSGPSGSGCVSLGLPSIPFASGDLLYDGDMYILYRFEPTWIREETPSSGLTWSQEAEHPYDFLINDESAGVPWGTPRGFRSSVPDVYNSNLIDGYFELKYFHDQQKYSDISFSIEPLASGVMY